MQGLEEMKEEVHSLKNEITGLRPLVHEMHGNMPRIATALETLAKVTERLESNTEDHKRIHYRITENEKRIEKTTAHHEDLEEKFYQLRDEFITCSTSSKVRLSLTEGGLVARLKYKAAEQAVGLTVGALLMFFAWLVISNLPHYPATAAFFKGGSP